MQVLFPGRLFIPEKSTLAPSEPQTDHCLPT